MSHHDVLTQKQIDFYDENGFLVVENVLSPSEADQVLAVCKAQADEQLAPLFNLYRIEPSLYALMKNKTIVSMLKTLQRAPIVGLMSQMLFKQAGTPYAAQAWNPHQDNSYPQGPKGAYITINLFLEDADRENGCMYMYPKSHAEPLLPFIPTVTGVNAGNTIEPPPQYEKVDLHVKKGSMLILHGHVIHGSYSNTSPTRSRPLLSFSYITKGAKFFPGRTGARTEISVED